MVGELYCFQVVGVMLIQFIYTNNYRLDINLSMTMIYLFKFSQYFDEFPGCWQHGNGCTLLHYYRNTTKHIKKMKYYFKIIWLKRKTMRNLTRMDVSCSLSCITYIVCFGVFRYLNGWGYLFFLWSFKHVTKRLIYTLEF